MSTSKKNSARGKKAGKKNETFIVVDGKRIPIRQPLFPEKLEHAQSILRRTKFLEK